MCGRHCAGAAAQEQERGSAHPGAARGDLAKAAAPSVQIWTVSLDALVELPWHREGELFHETNGLLFLYSIIMALSVQTRLRVEKTRFVFALVLALIAFTSNVVLGLLWSLPAIFCWLAAREVVTPDPS